MELDRAFAETEVTFLTVRIALLGTIGFQVPGLVDGGFDAQHRALFVVHVDAFSEYKET